MPRVFLSYAHEDVVYAERLAQILERQPNISVWRDKDDLVGGEEWERRIQREIANADFFVPLTSSAFFSGPRFAHREVELAVQEKARRSEDSRFIVPVRLDDSELALEQLQGLHSIDLFRNARHGLYSLFSALGAYRDSDGAAAKARVTAHQARFAAHPRMYYFITVVNISDRPFSITHVHYQDPEQYLQVAPRGRRLPYMLPAGDLWATYLPMELLPADFRANAFDKFFVRLATGEIKRSLKEDSVLARGSVPGGPIVFPDDWDNPRDY